MMGSLRSNYTHVRGGVWGCSLFFVLFGLAQSPLLLGVTSEYPVKGCQVINKHLSSVAITWGGQGREGWNLEKQVPYHCRLGKLSPFNQNGGALVLASEAMQELLRESSGLCM